MSGLPADRYALPSRAQLRSASPWVWTLLVLAAVDVALSLMATQTMADLNGFVRVAQDILAPAGLIVAATLVYVAPRERLIQVAALGLALPETIQIIRLSLPGISATADATHSWANLGQTLSQWTDGLSSVMWIATAVGVFALALYVGRVQSRVGWLIVAASAVLAVALALVNASQWLSLVNEIGGGLILAGSDRPSLFDLIAGTIGQIVIIGFGYLLAVTYELRMWRLAVAAGAHLLSTLVFLVTATVLSDFMQSDASGQSVTALNLVFVVIAAVYLVAFVLGLLTELPREGHTTDSARDLISTPEVVGAGR